MKVMAINGSPRTKWNTATVLQHALDGAASAHKDAECEMINLYELNYKGCISCFQCKRIGGSSYGRCAVKDELKPVLNKMIESDVLIFGSPIYFSDVTGMARCMFERLCFPLFVYDKDYTSLAPKKVHTGFIYTMNVPYTSMEQIGYPARLSVIENVIGRIFSHTPHVQYVNNTFQFPDYSKYMSELFSPEEKKAYREKHFPEDCKDAYQMGAALVLEAMAEQNQE